MIDIDWQGDDDTSEGYAISSAKLPGEMALVVEGDQTGVEWFVGPNEMHVLTGEADSIDEGQSAAVEAWRRWAREQAEACGFTVTEGE